MEERKRQRRRRRLRQRQRQRRRQRKKKKKKKKKKKRWNFEAVISTRNEEKSFTESKDFSFVEMTTSITQQQRQQRQPLQLFNHENQHNSRLAQFVAQQTPDTYRHLFHHFQCAAGLVDAVDAGRLVREYD